ncbi:MAG: histidine phosphatase family protein [Thermomicrobiales bacterium]
MKHLYVVTHAQSQHHTEGRVGGWYDNGLTDLGLSQASRIGQRIRELLPADAPVEFYSSDLMRAYQTAEAIARLIRAPIQTTADLREKSYGDAEGKPQSWLDERFVYPPKVGNRMDHWEGISGAESRREIAGRIYRAMDRILASPCSYQIIVTHGFALTFVVAAWIKMPLDSVGHIAVQSTSGGITHLFEDDVFSNRGITSLNETVHLDRAETRIAT